MKIERSSDGIYRLMIWGGWGVGFGGSPGLWYFARYFSGGWSLRVLWFHIGHREKTMTDCDERCRKFEKHFARTRVAMIGAVIYGAIAVGLIGFGVWVVVRAVTLG